MIYLRSVIGQIGLGVCFALGMCSAASAQSILTIQDKFVDADSLSGVVDGVNRSFSLSAAPNPPSSLVLFRNGMAQQQGSDYNLAGQIVTFVPAAVPHAGDTLVGCYRTSVTNATGTVRGDLVVDGGVSGNSGGLYFRNSSNVNGGTRNNALISTTGALAGRIVNRNTEMLDGVVGYTPYDNSGLGHTTLSSELDSQAPNSSGKVLRISYDGKGMPNSYPSPGPTPGYGGFYVALGRCSGPNNAVNGYCYREGNRYLIRMWVKLPAGYTLEFASNGFGNGGSYTWTTPNAGVGDWRLYEAILTIGMGGTFNSTGFWYSQGNINLAFTWDVGKLEMVGVDESPTVQSAGSLNIGYSQGTNLDFGELLSTSNTYLAASRGRVGIGTTVPVISGTGKFHHAGNTIRVVDSPRSPGAASEFCNFGEIAVDSTYLYVCSTPGSWRRVPLATF